jgi:aryl-alcohol dehydrogenase-like predicted oxidoreductase
MDGAEASLRRLQTDHIDLYQIHGNGFVTPVEETIRALDSLVQQAEAARASEAEKWRHLTVSTVFEDGRFDSRLYMAKSGINS